MLKWRNNNRNYQTTENHGWLLKGKADGQTILQSPEKISQSALLIYLEQVPEKSETIVSTTEDYG